MSKIYYSDCCWSPVIAGEWLQDTNEVIMGQCPVCEKHSGNLLTQVEINQKIKEFIDKKSQGKQR